MLKQPKIIVNLELFRDITILQESKHHFQCCTVPNMFSKYLWAFNLNFKNCIQFVSYLIGDFGMRHITHRIGHETFSKQHHFDTKKMAGPNKPLFSRAFIIDTSICIA